jgi:hypothetical protein
VRGGGEGKLRILIGQSVPPTPFGMAFGLLKLSPLVGGVLYSTVYRTNVKNYRLNSALVSVPSYVNIIHGV